MLWLWLTCPSQEVGEILQALVLQILHRTAAQQQKTNELQMVCGTESSRVGGEMCGLDCVT